MPRHPDAVSDAMFRLLLAPGLGPRIIARLLDAFGSPEAAVEASATALMGIRGISDGSAKDIRKAINEADPAAERAAMAQTGVSMILKGDEDYPALLAAVPSAPPALWIRGELRPIDQIAVAMVGSRNSTAYGVEQAMRLSSLLAECGVTIVSGGALGIDAACHRGALRVNGRTVVVMGCGLAHDYPKRHREMYETIAAGHGAIVSEFPMHVTPNAPNFPRRNRIISGLSLGVVVIEAGRRSGALITARIAAEDHGREVMAIPGRIDAAASRGCNELIRDGGAALVLDHVDVLDRLQSAGHLIEGASGLAGGNGLLGGGTESGGDEPRHGESGPSSLDPHQAAIVEAMRGHGRSLRPDEIGALTGRPMHELMAQLTLLQIRGVLVRDQDGFQVRPGRRTSPQPPAASET